MPDLQKVIKGLEQCTARPLYGKRPNACNGCQYLMPGDFFNSFRCDSQQMMRDAVALLKEQESWINEIAEYQQSISGSGMHELDDYEKGKWDGLQIAWNIISEGR